MMLPDSEYPNNIPSQKDRAALHYAERGWPVFPLHSIDEHGRCSCPLPEGHPDCTPGKHPRTRHGHKDASTDPRQIRDWWARWPDANIGISTGKRSGILTLDVDQTAGLDALEAEHGELPATRTHSTGSGGMHYLFAYPAGVEIRNSASKLAEGLDVRGEGGYIVAPPSNTSRPYEVLDELPLAETPARLIEALRKPQRAASGPRITTAVTTLDGPIPAGTRDDTLTSIAGRLHDGTRALEELTGELLEVNTNKCLPPLPDAQVEKIARSIHARTPCKKSTRASAKTVEALEEIERKLWRREWRGMGELSDRDLFVALIKAGREHGELIPSGVRVSISVRALALAAAVSKRTAHYAIKRLKAAGLIRSDNAGRSGTQSGALVLVSNALEKRAALHHSSTPLRRDSSGATLRAPRLRWSAPVITRDGLRETVRRLGKSCGAVIDALERCPSGSATVEELADALHKKRPRDLRRRVISRLEGTAVVECSGDTVSLTRDWLDALNRERSRAGEIRNEKGEDGAYERDMKRYAREREAYRYHRGTKPNLVPERPPAKLPAAVEADGCISELERVVDSERRGEAGELEATDIESSAPLTAGELEALAAIRAYEDKYGAGSFRWDRASCKAMFYQGPIPGCWPAPDELARIRDHVTGEEAA